MKTLIRFLFSKTIGRFFCFVGLYFALLVNSQAAGFVDVSALSVSELPVTLGQNFKINFYLKEYRHDSKNFEYIEVRLRDKNNKDIYQVKKWDNVAFSADQERYFSATTYLYSNRSPGNYYVVVRGKTYGGNPFDFKVVPNTYASNPYKFTAIYPIQANVVFSNYGPGNSAGLCDSGGCRYWDTGKHDPEQPYSQGMAFTVPSGSSYKLSAISVTAFDASLYYNPPLEPATYVVSVNEDVGGLPGAVLDQFTFSKFNGADYNRLHNDAVFLTGISSRNPTLYAGTQYWLTTDVSKPNQMNVGWPMNNQGSVGHTTYRSGSGSWNSVYGTETLGAFRVMGTPISNSSSTLRLYTFYDENTTHPFLISATNPSSKSGYIKTDINIKNHTGTWFEVDVNFDAPSDGARWPINLADGKPIPFAFLIGPYGEKTLRDIQFTEGRYLQLNVTRTSSAAFSALAMDMISRALLGEPLPINIFDGDTFDGAIVVIENLFTQIRSHCSGELGAFGLNVTNKNITGAIEHLGQFVLCTKTVKKEILALVRHIFGQESAVKFTEILNKELSSILSLLFNAPSLIDLTYGTFDAEVDGFVRLEARQRQ